MLEENPKFVVPEPSIEAVVRPPARSPKPYDDTYAPINARAAKESKASFYRGLLIGLLTATIVVGAAMGGGLGSALSSREEKIKALQAHSLPATTTTISTATTSAATTSATTSDGLLADYAPARPSIIANLRKDCEPNVTMRSNWGDTFVQYCDTDTQIGGAAVEGGTVQNIMGLTAYTFLDCVNACSGLDRKAGSYNSTTPCRAIAFVTNIRNHYDTNDFGNCWLKNGTLSNMKEAGFGPDVQTAICSDCSSG